MNAKICFFVLYSILYEAIIWGVFGYAVFILNHSGWWMVFALPLSASQFKPRHFGIKETMSTGGKPL